MTILRHPYSDSSKYSAGGIWAPTAVNFPCVPHFWSCPQTDIGKNFGSGTGGLTDLMGTAHLLKSTGVALAAPAAPDGYSVFPNQAATGTTMQGTLAAVGSKYLLTLAVGSWGVTGGPVIGDITNGEAISLAVGGGLTDLVVSQALLAGGQQFQLVSQVSGRAILVRTWDGAAAGTTGMASFEANKTSTISDLGDTATTAIEAFTTYGAVNKWSCSSTNLALHGMAFILFTSLPSDLFVKYLVAWHTYQWANGNKWLCPALKNVP